MNGESQTTASGNPGGNRNRVDKDKDKDWFRIARYISAAILLIIILPLVCVATSWFADAASILKPNTSMNWPSVAAYFLTIAGRLGLLAMLLYFVLALLRVDDY